MLTLGIQISLVMAQVLGAAVASGSYIDESGNQYTDESGNTYVTESYVAGGNSYVAENGTDIYTDESGNTYIVET